jgi:hypothetical protein
MIDWSKLQPYKSDKYGSFEELCFQIAKGLHGYEGRFTSVDDSLLSVTKSLSSEKHVCFFSR